MPTDTATPTITGQTGARKPLVEKRLTPHEHILKVLQVHGFRQDMKDIDEIMNVTFQLMFGHQMDLLFGHMKSKEGFSIAVESDCYEDLFSRQVLFELLLIPRFYRIILESSNRYRVDERLDPVDRFHLTNGEKRVIGVIFKKP